MAKCRNDNCNKNPFDNESQMIRVSEDADYVCSEECKAEYEKQRDEFFDNIGNDAWYNEYMNINQSNH